jgi:hypothetical protein
MATSSTKSKPASMRTGKGKTSTGKTTRPQYDEKVVAIATAARKMACPTSLQGPVPRQVHDVQRVLKDPREAIKSAGISQKALKGYATGSGDKEVRAALRPLGQRIVEAGGAKQWVTGRPLAATLTAWLEAK